MTTARALRDVVSNALDFLQEVGLVLYSTSVSFDDYRVGWHGSENGPFLLDFGHATTEQYLAWAAGSHYSALMPDGSLLQIAYRLTDGTVVGHRLAYIPCPVILNEDLLLSGEPVADAVELYAALEPTTSLALRSPVRFDYDPGAAGPEHPPAHLTINSPSCRIACVAPLHPYRFIDFVFRHFYPELRGRETAWFDAAATQNLGERVLADGDARRPHVMWELHRPPSGARSYAD